MQIGKIMPLNIIERTKQLVFFVATFCLCFLNFNVSLVGNSKIYIGQFVLMAFIAWGLLVARKISWHSLKVFTVFGVLLLIASLLGRHNEWFYNDLVKIIFLTTSMLMYVNIFDSKAELSKYVRIVACMFVAAVIFYLPFNLGNIYNSSRLMIANFGKGGEDLGWAAAVIYISGLWAFSQSRRKKIDTILLVSVLCIAILSLSRDALLAIAVYSLLSKKRRLIYHMLVAIPLSLLIIYFSFVTNIVSYQTFMVVNGYRFFIPKDLFIPKGLPTLTFQSKIEKTHSSKEQQDFVEESDNFVEIKNMDLFLEKQFEWLLTGRTLIWMNFLKYYSNLNLTQKLFGCGIGSVTLSVKKAGFLSRDTHSLYLDILLNFGAVGLLFFVIGVVKSIKVFISQHAYESLAILLSVLSAGLFNGLWRFSSVIWLTAFIAVMPYILQKISVREQ